MFSFHLLTKFQSLTKDQIQISTTCSPPTNPCNSTFPSSRQVSCSTAHCTSSSTAFGSTMSTWPASAGTAGAATTRLSDEDAELNAQVTIIQAAVRGKQGRQRVEVALIDKELRRARKKFDQMDADGNGSLDAVEMDKLAVWVLESFHPGGQPLTIDL